MVVRRTGNDQVGQERSFLFLLQPLVGRGQQLPLRCDLRPAVDRDRNELGHRLVGRDQRHLNKRGFNRLEQGLGIEEQDVRKRRTGDLPIPHRDFA